MVRKKLWWIGIRKQDRIGWNYLLMEFLTYLWNYLLIYERDYQSLVFAMMRGISELASGAFLRNGV